MIKPSAIHPDTDLRDILSGNITVGTAGGGTKTVAVYGDWEHPTKSLPDDFISIELNGDPEGVAMDADFARGYLMVVLYCKLNNDGSVKKNRISKILAQFEDTVNRHVSNKYFFEYDTQRFITPTIPNFTSGYSETILNLKWHTVNKVSNN